MIDHHEASLSKQHTADLSLHIAGLVTLYCHMS